MLHKTFRKKNCKAPGFEDFHAQYDIVLYFSVLFFFKQGSISNEGDGIAVATAIVNTALGTSAAGISTLLFNKIGWIPGTGGNYSFLITMNGSLTGKTFL